MNDRSALGDRRHTGTNGRRMEARDFGPDPEQGRSADDQAEIAALAEWSRRVEAARVQRAANLAARNADAERFAQRGLALLILLCTVLVAIALVENVQ